MVFSEEAEAVSEGESGKVSLVKYYFIQMGLKYLD